MHIATVYRRTPKAKRYVFRLTEKPFRHLKPGRYLVQVRVGTSRTALGPAASRQLTIRRGRSADRPIGPPTRGAGRFGAAGPYG